MDQRSAEQISPPATSNTRSALATTDATSKRLSFIQRTKELISSKFQKTKNLLTSEQTRRGANLQTTEEETPDSKFYPEFIQGNRQILVVNLNDMEVIQQGNKHSIKESLKKNLPGYTEDDLNQAVRSYQDNYANDLFDARVSPDDPLLDRINTLFESEDTDAIRDHFNRQISEHIRNGTLPQPYINGKIREFQEDQAWIDSWKAYFETHPGPEAKTANSVAKGKESTAPVPSSALEKVTQMDTALSTQISQYAAQALERIQGKLPTREQLAQLSQAIKKRIERAKVFGQPLPDFLAGALTGAAAKQAARWGLMSGGFGGFPAAAAAGAAAGATSAGAREYLRQRREIKTEETEEAKSIKAKLKNEWRILKSVDKARMGKAMARGAVWGAVGGVVGASVVDMLHGGEGIHEVQEKIGQAAKFFQEKGGVAVQTVQEKAGPAAEIIKGKTTEALNTAGKFIKKPDATATLNVSPTEAVAQQVPQPQISPELATAPEVVHLPAGSNPWQEVAEKLRNDLHRVPTNAEILEADKIVSARSNIAVPSWGIQGENLHTQLPVGYALNFDEPYKNFIQEILDKKPAGIPAPEVSSPAELHQALPTTTSPAEVTTHAPVVTPTPPPTPHEAIPIPINTSAPTEGLPPQHPTPVRLPTPPVTETVQPPSQISEAAAPTPAESQAGTFNLPNQIEKINLTPDVLATWSDVPEYLKNYLEQNLGREATEPELKGAIDIFRADNSINPAKIPSGIEFKLSGINQYIQKILTG